MIARWLDGGGRADCSEPCQLIHLLHEAFTHSMRCSATCCSIKTPHCDQRQGRFRSLSARTHRQGTLIAVLPNQPELESLRLGLGLCSLPFRHQQLLGIVPPQLTAPSLPNILSRQQQLSAKVGCLPASTRIAQRQPKASELPRLSLVWAPLLSITSAHEAGRHVREMSSGSYMQKTVTNPLRSIIPGHMLPHQMPALLHLSAHQQPMLHLQCKHTGHADSPGLPSSHAKLFA